MSTHVSQFVRKIITINNMIGGFHPLAGYREYFMDDESTFDTDLSRMGEIDVLANKFFVLLGSQKIFFFQANEFGAYEKLETSI